MSASKALAKKLDAFGINAGRQFVRVDRKTFEAIHDLVRETPSLRDDLQIQAVWNGQVGFNGLNPGRINEPPPGQQLVVSMAKLDFTDKILAGETNHPDSRAKSKTIERLVF
jgi:hypothetical protein